VDVGSLGKIQVNPKASLDWLPTDKEYVYGTYVRQKDEITQCHWLWSGMAINWDGNVSPCCIVDDARTDFGSIFTEKLESLWNNAQYLNSRATFADPLLIDGETICTICKNDTHNPDLKRYKNTFSLVRD
jgi:MoaA/NifB/PqqE/SkfB family radical SAM enzyme